MCMLGVVGNYGILTGEPRAGGSGAVSGHRVTVVRTGKANTVSLEDKLAIQEVIAQYSYTYDAQDAEGFAALFTEDAVWELYACGATHPEMQLVSRAAIRAWAAQRLHERRGHFTSRHYQSGLLFEALTADAARTRTMVLVTHQ